MPIISPIAPRPERASDTAGASARTARYAARLDEYLASLPGNAARLAFLSSELVKWSARYNRFVNRIDAGHDPDPVGATVYDYLETICEISTRKERLQEGAS